MTKRIKSVDVDDPLPSLLPSLPPSLLPYLRGRKGKVTRVLSALDEQYVHHAHTTLGEQVFVLC